MRENGESRPKTASKSFWGNKWRRLSGERLSGDTNGEDVLGEANDSDDDSDDSDKEVGEDLLAFDSDQQENNNEN